MVTLSKAVTPAAMDAAEGDDLTQLRAKRVHNIRRAARTIRDREALSILFNDLSTRYAERPGGYTRVLKDGFRPGDNAPMAVIEFIGTPVPATEEGANADEFGGEE